MNEQRVNYCHAQSLNKLIELKRNLFVASCLLLFYFILIATRGESDKKFRLPQRMRVILQCK